jgi:hypothetical protein
MQRTPFILRLSVLLVAACAVVLAALQWLVPDPRYSLMAVARKHQGGLGSLDVSKCKDGTLVVWGPYENERAPPNSKRYAAVEMWVGYSPVDGWAHRWAVGYSLMIAKRGQPAGRENTPVTIPLTDGQLVAKHARFFQDVILGRVASDVASRTGAVIPVGAPGSPGYPAARYTGRIVEWEMVWLDCARAALGVIVAAGGLLIVCSLFRAHRRRRLGLCARCGYSLAGISEEQACPECGARGRPRA